MTMRIRRHGRPDAEEAERLLRTGLGGVAVNGDPLAGLLVAAAAPARPDELAGEDAALVAFRGARAEAEHSPPIRVRRPWRRTAGTVWIAVAAATATAGVAVAASVQSRDEPPQPRPSAVPTPGQRSTPVGPGTGGDGPAPSVADPTPNVIAPTVDPQTVGLCRAYLAKDRAERRRSLGTPAFRALVTAAGEPDKVDAYCRQMVLASPEHDQPSADHARASTPEQDPTAKPVGKAPD
jgi:hypothetical protein